MRVVIALISVLIALPDIIRHQFGANAVGAIILGGLLFVLYGLTLTASDRVRDNAVHPLNPSP